MMCVLVDVFVCTSFSLSCQLRRKMMEEKKEEIKKRRGK
jgi:hypothetical protein